MLAGAGIEDGNADAMQPPLTSSGPVHVGASHRSQEAQLCHAHLKPAQSRLGVCNALRMCALHGLLPSSLGSFHSSYLPFTLFNARQDLAGAHIAPASTTLAGADMIGD